MLQQFCKDCKLVFERVLTWIKEPVPQEAVHVGGRVLWHVYSDCLHRNTQFSDLHRELPTSLWVLYVRLLHLAPLSYWQTTFQTHSATLWWHPAHLYTSRQDQFSVLVAGKGKGDLDSTDVTRSTGIGWELLGRRCGIGFRCRWVQREPSTHSWRC